MKSGMSIMFDNPWRKGPRSIHEQVPHIEERRAKHQDRRSVRVEDAKSGSFHVSSALSGLALLFFRSVSIISNMIDMLLLEKIL